MANQNDKQRQSQPTGKNMPPEGKQAGNPGDVGSDPKESVGGSEKHGVFPASAQNAPDDATPQGMASFGQGERGAQGYQDHGGSELDIEDLEPREAEGRDQSERRSH